MSAVPAENFTGPFWFKVEYEIQVSEALLGWLKDSASDYERTVLLSEHLAVRSPHISIVGADSEADWEDELWEGVWAS